MYHCVAEKAYLKFCQQIVSTTENSMEKVEKTIPNMGRFLKSQKFDLIKKPFPFAAVLKFKPILTFYVSLCS